MRFIKQILFLLIFILTIHLPSQTSAQDICFNFRDTELSCALDSLIFNYNIFLLYLKNQVQNIKVNASCSECTEEQALQQILQNSSLHYKMVNSRYILFNTETEKLHVPDHSFTINGRIMDSLTQEALPYASVIIEGKGFAANLDGSFSVDQLPPDIYKLKVLYIGYNSDSILVDLRLPQNNKVIDIKLSPSNTEIDAVIIKGNKLQTNPISSGILSSKLEPRQLKNIPTLDPGDLIQNIKLLPEASSLPDNLTGFTIHGGTMDQVLVQFDGIPLYHTGHLWGFNSSQNSNTIETVNVYSGGFSAKYGDRLSGVLDMKGRTGRNDKAEGSFYANLFSSKVHVSIPVLKKANVLFSINSSTDIFDYNQKMLNRSDYMFFNHYSFVQANKPLDGSAWTSGNTFPTDLNQSSKYYDLYSKIEIAVGKNDSVSFSAIYNYDEISMDALVETKLYDENYSSSREENWNTKGFNFNYKKRFSTNITLNNGMTWSEYSNNSDFRYIYYIDTLSNIHTDSTTNNNRNTIYQSKIYSNIRWSLKEYLSLTFGFEYKTMNVNFHQDGIRWPDEFYFQGMFANHSQTNEYIGFIEEDISIFKIINLNVGTRFTYTKNIDKTFFEPRISTGIRFNRSLSAQGSWGKYHQNLFCSPSYISLNVTSFNSSYLWFMAQPGLDPSTSEHWLIGLKYHKKKFSARISAYLKTMENLAFIIPSVFDMAVFTENDPHMPLFLEWSDNRNYITNYHKEGNEIFFVKPELHYINADRIDYFKGEGYSKGLEVYISKDLGIHTGFISYHLGKTVYLFPYINSGEEFYAEYDRTHELKIMNNLHWKKWNLGCIYTYISGKPYPSNYKVLAFYSNHSLGIDHPIKWDLSNIDRTKQYQSVDLNLSKKITFYNRIDLLLGITVHNLLNRKNEISKYHTTKIDLENNNTTKINDELFTQYGIERLFNVFISVEF